MTDRTGCDGNGSRTFCCSNKEQPFCQWLFHNNGACKPGCPYDDMVEVASLKLTCDSGKAQVACCRGDTKALDVYRQYKWYGKESECATDLGEKQCGWSSKFNSPLVSSWSGSGAQVCYDSDGKKGTRPLCEDARDETKPHFANCIWSDDYYMGRRDTVSTGTCNSNCPKGMVKVALQSKNNRCGKGTSAYCCDITATYDLTDVGDDELESALKEWAKDPKCPNLSLLTKSVLSSRSLDNMALDVGEGLSDLAERDAPHIIPGGIIVALAFRRMMIAPPGSRSVRDLQSLVDTYITPVYPHITGAYLVGVLWQLRDRVEAALLAAWAFICNINAEEQEAKKDIGQHIGKLNDPLVCHIPSLDTYDPGSLEDPRDQSDDGFISDFFGPSGPLSPLGNLGFPFNEMGWSSEWDENDGLEKRGVGKARPFKPQCPDKSTWTMKSETYINGDKGEALAKKTGDDKMFYVKDNGGGDCISATVEDDGKPNDGKKWVCE
ncbi:hypothetical protein FOMA001_g13522 [Fusarium oxysporum f. sp. matthiolae]|nr:hypothetical protein FOMA001_g13522 [Fusarium oxysporum f. sp. matthiolae]